MNGHPKLPPLAGLCTLEEAAKPGLSVAECVRRLKRFHYAFVRLHGPRVTVPSAGCVSFRSCFFLASYFFIVS